METNGNNNTALSSFSLVHATVQILKIREILIFAMRVIISKNFATASKMGKNGQNFFYFCEFFAETIFG